MKKKAGSSTYQFLPWPWCWRFSSLFIVDERENVPGAAIRSGEARNHRARPGLQNSRSFRKSVRYDARILGLQTQPLEVTPTGTDRRLVVDPRFCVGVCAMSATFAKLSVWTACAAHRAGSKAS